MDPKAALSDTLERTLLLAWTRPAHHTQVCLRSSHARTLAWRNWNLFFGNAPCATPMLCQTKTTFSRKTKHASPCLLSLDHSTTHMFFHLSNHEPAQSAARVSSLSCHLHARTCLLRKPCLCAQSFIRSSVPTKPSHSTLGQQTTEALPNDDAVTDTTTDGQKRNGRDLTARAERSTLGLKAQSSRKTITSCSLRQGGDLTVPEITRKRQRGPTLELQSTTSGFRIPGVRQNSSSTSPPQTRR